MANIKKDALAHFVGQLRKLKRTKSVRIAGNGQPGTVRKPCSKQKTTRRHPAAACIQAKNSQGRYTPTCCIILTRSQNPGMGVLYFIQVIQVGLQLFFTPRTSSVDHELHVPQLVVWRSKANPNLVKNEPNTLLLGASIQRKRKVPDRSSCNTTQF